MVVVKRNPPLIDARMIEERGSGFVDGGGNERVRDWKNKNETQLMAARDICRTKVSAL